MEMIVGQAGWRDESFSENQRGKMHVLFYEKQVPHPARSKAEGRPVFITQVRIKKLVPGDQYNQPDRPIREGDAEQFPEAWARYVNKRENKVPGTPIEAWGILTDTQIAEFKAMNIFTVDQFAELTDGVGGKIMHFNDLRKRARAFVSLAKDAEANAKMQEELAKRDAEIAAMREQLAALSAAQGVEVKRGPGRPPKIAEA